MKKELLICTFILAGLTCNGQLVKRPVIIESKIHTGMILPFYDALAYLIKDDIYAFDLSVSFPTFGKDYWEKLYNYPRTGIGFSYWTLSNNEVFGKAYSLYSYINLPIIRRDRKFSLNYQISLGGAYLTKRFDIYENHLNRAIGSHINIYIRLGVDGKIQLFPRSELVLEAGLTHFSNGKTKSPNYGINAGSFSLGINYSLGNYDNTRTDQEIPGINKRFIQSISVTAGSKVYDNLLDKRYFVSSVSYNIENKISHRRRIGLGAAFFYDGSITEALATEDGTNEQDLAKLIRLGMHGSYSARYKQLVMGIQLGYYLYSKYTDLSPVYSKISVQYLLSENVAGIIALKAHMGKAECLEWGIGYCW